MRGHAGPRPGDEPITTRLTPKIILMAKGIEKENFFSDEFPDKDSYRLIYRMWGNHQRMEFQNKNMGYLEIVKETSKSKIEFKVRKVIVNFHNLTQTITATLLCENDDIITPLSYDYSSRITDNALCTRPDLSLDRSGCIEDGYVIEKIKGKEYKRQYESPLVFDFTVYDLVVSGKEYGPFTYYENLYSFKPGNRLMNLTSESTLGNHKFKMMVQYGTGLTERIFHISSAGLPVMMVQNSAVYILDEDAPNAIGKLQEELNTGGVHYEY